MSTESRKLVELTKKIATDLGVQFCTQCNETKYAEGGKYKPTSNGTMRWKCRTCLQKLRPSGFKKETA